MAQIDSILERSLPSNRKFSYEISSETNVYFPNTRKLSLLQFSASLFLVLSLVWHCFGTIFLKLCID